MNTSEQLFAEDTNGHIFQFQKNQEVFNGLFDKDRVKAELADKISKYFLENKFAIPNHTNQKIISEIKHICETKLWAGNKKLFFNEDYLKELYSDYPGAGYTQQDLDTIQAWRDEITNPDQKFNSADMLIYVIFQRSGVTVIITDDTGDFKYCQTIYHQHHPGSRHIDVWNLQETINNLGITN